MTHSHDHSHTHSHAPDSFNLAFALAVSFNLAFTIIEAVYAIVAHSMSLLADAGHNLGDVLGLLLAWLASWLLTQPARKRFSYGFKRTSILAALINALILVGTSAIIAYESIHKLIHPVVVNEIIVIMVAFIGLLINSGTALLFFKGRSTDLNIKGAFLHLAYDSLVSLGVVITGIIIYYTGFLWLDPLVGLGIVIVILLGTWGLLRESANLIMDAVPQGVEHGEVKQYLENLPEVSSVHDLHIWGLSTKETALTAHLVMPGKSLSDNDHHRINHELAEKFNINHVTLQVEQGSNEYSCEQLKSC